MGGPIEGYTTNLVYRAHISQLKWVQGFIAISGPKDGQNIETG